MRKVNEEEIKALKGQGFILQNNNEDFVCRVITVDGTLKKEKLCKLGEIADKYGYGHISFTTRLTVEIPGIKYESIENVKRELEEVGLYSGGTGNRVRPVVACKGTVCKFGLLDTQSLAREVHEKFYLGFYDMKLPHKFKIGIAGCPNNCTKADLNDFGIVGGKKGSVKIFLGGKWGKKPKIGEELGGLYSLEEALNIMEKVILAYKDESPIGERFGTLVDRIGVEAFK